ncbi:MAG: hypothetical protein SGBAC_003437 [Bacillariaceae sp.]
MPLQNTGNRFNLKADYLVVVDFEATCNDSNGGKNPCLNPQEIIEFPAVLLNVKTGEVEDEFHHYILPDVHPKLSAFCSELTGITQETVDQGISLKNALHLHYEWINSHNLTNDLESQEKDKSRFLYVTCGDWDLKTCLPSQLAHHNQAVPQLFSNWVNLKKSYGNIYNRKARGMTAMLEDLGLKLEGRSHSGIDDSRNIARVCAQMLTDGWQPSATTQSSSLMDAQAAMAGMQLSPQKEANAATTAENAENAENDGWAAAPTKNSKKRRNKGKRRNLSSPEWSSPPIMVEPIPPTSQTTSFSPFMILLIGLPGSGKSTFSNLLMEAMPYKFARINQDQLGSRQKCLKAANQALDENKCIILDRCNFDAAQRSTWLDLAKKRRIPVYGLALQVPKPLCIQRCQGRGAHETIAAKDAAKVVNIVARGFQLPSKAEQGMFGSYRTLLNSSMLDDAVIQFLNQNS